MKEIRGYAMMKRYLILLALVSILVTMFLVVPVSAGLNITDGTKITSPYGATSPVITITGSDFPAGDTITIDVPNLYMLVYHGAFTDANVVVNDTASAASWTGAVSGAGDLITLTSTGGTTSAGENITITFTGGGGNPWLPDTTTTYGNLSLPLTVTRTDTRETATISFMIETPTPPPGGLTITDGSKIITPDGATSPVITIADSDIPEGGTITIQVPDLHFFVNNGTFTEANIAISDTASAAGWTGSVSGAGDLITLTSTGGTTSAGENITITFTGGGGNPWLPDTSSRFGDVALPLTVTRTDTFQTASLNFMINTTPLPGGLSLADGAKITSTLGATSPIITIAGSNISRGGAITIDIAGLNPYVANGTLTDANMVINDTAAHATWTGLVAGNILTLTSTEGNTTIGENVAVTFTGAGGNPWIPNTQGIQTIPLTVFRTDTSQTGMFNFIIETAPPAGLTVVANFTASPSSDTAPLAVSFTDTSLGSPTMWIWDFGDGSTSTSQNPYHTYLNEGMYTVSLNVTNMYGSDTKTQWNYIRVLVGDVREARTSIPGLTIDNCGGPQMVTVNTSILTADLVQNNFVLEIQPPAESGFKNITISAMNRQGFARNGNLIFGNPTSTHLVTDELAPSSGFSSDIGTNSSFNYSIDLPSYPCNAILITKIWGGVISEYDNKLRRIVDGNNASVVGTAYTAKITRTNFPSDARVVLHMSVNSSWNPSLHGGPGMMFIWRIADDGNSGQILPTKYLSSDPVHNLDYYEADSLHGLSTFGLSSFTGNNNPFQLITFVIADVINPKNGGGGSSSGGQTTTVPPGMKPSIAPDSGNTVKIYANTEGVITQETMLKSTDGLANVSLGRGIVARNSSGKPLSMLSIIRIPAEDIPAGSPGAGLSFTGIAYELQPDGATFYPSIPLSFTIPQAQWGEEYVIQEYDNGTGTWEALPGSYNPQTGIISAQIFHLCSFALFTKPMAIEKTESPTPNTVPGVSEPAISTDVGMYGWIVRTILDKPQIIVIAAALIAVVACVVWWRRRL